jgi:MFS superfamily sulfate permease-like transporter
MLLPGAVALTLVAFAESIGPARSFADKHKYTVDADQELVGLGTANLGAGLFQGFSIGASLSKSAANDAAGARSQLSGIFAAALTVVVALFLTPLFYNLPEATLAAIVIVAVSGMIKIGPIRRLYHIRKADFWLAIAAMLGVMTFEEVTTGLLFAVALSLLALIYRASQSKLAVLGRIPGRLVFVNQQRHPESGQIPGVLVLRPEEGLFFANASSLHAAIMKLVENSHESVSMVLLDLAITNDLDVPGADMLVELDEALSGRGIQLFLIRVHDPAQQILDRSGATEAIGPENFYPRIIDALLGHISDIAAEEQAEQIVEDLSDVLEEFIAVEEDTDGTRNAKLKALRHKAMDIVQESHQ